MISDGEYAVCPYCGYKHGDCWEWMDMYPEIYNCDNCGKQYKAYAEYEVTYVTEKS
jgi:DNA-directed RNA polymerase subunit RPC12/RpoP